MTITYIGGKSDGKLKPEIKQYLTDIRTASEKFPTRDDIPLAEFRKSLIKVRKEFNVGGPKMAKIENFSISTSIGEVSIRVYTPINSDNSLPCMFYLHGGGWVLLNLDTHDLTMRKLAHDCSMVVIGIDYKLAPEHRYPYQINEISAAIEYCINHATEFNIDKYKFLLGGDSAGANLAVASMQKLKSQDLDKSIKALLLIYGVYDCATMADSYYLHSDGQYLLDKEEMQWFIGNYLENDGQVYNHDVSPIFADLSYFPPVLMPIAELDVLYDENIDMHDHLDLQGVEVTANVYYGTMHSVLGAINYGKTLDVIFSDTTEWINKILDN